MSEEKLQVVCSHCDSINRVPAARLGDGPVCGQCKRGLFDGRPAALSAAGFARHIGASGIPVLVDFWAPWCGPCRMMAPAYEQAAAMLEPAIRVAKLNTEEAQAIAQQYQIRSIPTLALFRGGREIARQAGAMDARGIVAWVRQVNP